MPARELAALVRDRLLADTCLAPYLEPAATLVVHGADAACDQPLESHQSPGVRREQQGWPADFTRCVVTFGRFSRSPLNLGRDRSREIWSFVISGYARSTVKDELGIEQPGDLWLMDVYDIVTRIMTTHPGTDAQPCAGSPVLVAWREHVSDVRELSWDADLRAWAFQTRFRWWVIGPSLVPPANPCCAPVVEEDEQTHFILRHFEEEDLLNIDTAAVDYGDYDGFVYGHAGVFESVVAGLVASGKLCFRYYDIMTFGEAGWSDPWFDFWRGTVLTAWGAGLQNGAGDPAIFRLAPGCADRQFVDWSLIDASRRQTIADKMFELAPLSGLFLDQAWLHEAPFFFFSEPTTVGGCGACAYCATYASIDPAKWPLYQASIFAFYQLIDSMAQARGVWALKNGEHRALGTPTQSVPRPIYYENSATNTLEPPPPFESSFTGWREHPRNVLSIDVPDAVTLPTLLDRFETYGGWVAFTGGAASSAAVQSAYAQAAVIRAAHLV